MPYIYDNMNFLFVSFAEMKKEASLQNDWMKRYFYISLFLNIKQLYDLF